MKLLEYLNLHKLAFHVSAEGAIQVFATIGTLEYAGLWDVDDYLVSSTASGPSVWMVSKGARS